MRESLKEGERKSNILENRELIKRFNEVATSYAKLLKLKNYPIFSFMTVDDVVMESWKKVVQQGVSYDSNRGCKFDTFVRMIVSSVCGDLDRKNKKFYTTTSLDAEVVHRDEDMDTTTVSHFEEDRDNFMDLLNTEDVLESCVDDFNMIDLKTIIEMKSSGYTVREVAKSIGSRPKDVKTLLSCMEEVVEVRRYSDRTLADILYGDEDELERKRDKLTYILSYIMDDKYGIRLSDIVRLVIDGYSYRGIGEELGASKDVIKNILDRYQVMGI